MKSTFLRFFVVGLVNTIVGLSIMYFLFYLVHFSYWYATLSGILVGACVSYWLNRTYTFQSQKSIPQTVARFSIVIITCYAVSYFIGIHSVGWLIGKIPVIPPVFAEDAAILFGTALYTVLNYFGQKQYVFTK
jgi:putative flippase GtrA